MDWMLTPENYDGVVSALLGNGELCTTVGPTGFHIRPEQQSDIAHRTQRFVLAGRRRRGPQHVLANHGSIAREVLIDGMLSTEHNWQQVVAFREGFARSILQHEGIEERGSAGIAWSANRWWATRALTNVSRKSLSVTLRIIYSPGDLALNTAEISESGLTCDYSSEDLLGQLTFRWECAPAEGRLVSAGGGGFIWEASRTLEHRETLRVGVELQFSDRIHYHFPVPALPREDDAGPDPEVEGFWSTSEVKTGDPLVDSFRSATLYTLRCQATPWSTPPTLSEEYWGGGAFHDEMYPFLGLLSSGHAELAERIPYFRLCTLPQAIQRARARGALYPWSSTEYGEERDPHGLWLTERFHLGQFAVCVWMLWLYNRDLAQLDDLYPVLREIARYFELNMLERDEEDRLRTKACVDFDESVGEVTNGPFTICAAIVSLEYAANAAELLDRDLLRVPAWRDLAADLRQNLPTADSPAPVFTIPGGKPLHYSILGPVFPFRIEVDSERARESAALIHRVCRSPKGWKPGFSEVFEGSSWMWTAGHLGIVHALQGSADLAWEAIREAPASAGPFLSPNEHVDKDGVIHVPWFTTGCGGWLYALNCLFVQVDEEGAKLLPAVPSAVPNARFEGLLADQGVRVSGRFEAGELVELAARAPRSMPWRYRIPARYNGGGRLAGAVTSCGRDWLLVEPPELTTEPHSLLASGDLRP